MAVIYRRFHVSHVNEMGKQIMTAKILSRLAVLAAVIGLAAGCANTIRGVGQDTANAVNATQNAGQNVATAAER